MSTKIKIILGLFAALLVAVGAFSTVMADEELPTKSPECPYGYTQPAFEGRGTHWQDDGNFERHSMFLGVDNEPAMRRQMLMDGNCMENRLNEDAPAPRQNWMQRQQKYPRFQ